MHGRSKNQIYKISIFFGPPYIVAVLLPGAAAVAVTSEVRASAVLLLIVGSYEVKRFFDIRRSYLTELCESKRLQVYTNIFKVCSRSDLRRFCEHHVGVQRAGAR